MEGVLLRVDTVSFTGLIHMSRLKDKFATHFVPYSEFESDAAAGNLPHFSFIEPCLQVGHGDYHPAVSRALIPGADLDVDPPSAILAGETFLASLYETYRTMASPDGANVYNTSLFIGWDEPGGTYDHVPPGPVPPPDPSAPAGQMGFRFDRSGYRVPAILISPWVDDQVVTDEYRHTSMIATLRRLWSLGEPLTARDAAAATFDHLLSRATPRPPDEWPTPQAHTSPEYTPDKVKFFSGISTLGKAAEAGLRTYAVTHHLDIPGMPADPDTPLTPRQMQILDTISAGLFPKLAGAGLGRRSLADPA